MFSRRRSSIEPTARRSCPGCGRSMHRFPGDGGLCPACALLTTRLQGSFHPGAAAAGACSSLWRESDLGIVLVAFERLDEVAWRLVRGCRQGEEYSLRASAAAMKRRLWNRGLDGRCNAILPLRRRDTPLARALGRRTGPGSFEEMGKLTFSLLVTDVFSESTRADIRKRLRAHEYSPVVIATLVRDEFGDNWSDYQDIQRSRGFLDL
ncbi:MAG: hypothetical protein R6U92_06590 [Bacillota bacterium]